MQVLINTALIVEPFLDHPIKRRAIASFFLKIESFYASNNKVPELHLLKIEGAEKSSKVAIEYAKLLRWNFDAQEDDYRLIIIIKENGIVMKEKESSADKKLMQLEQKSTPEENEERIIMTLELPLVPETTEMPMSMPDPMAFIAREIKKTNKERDPKHRGNPYTFFDVDYYTGVKQLPNIGLRFLFNYTESMPSFKDYNPYNH